MSTMIAGCGFARMAWELAQYRRWFRGCRSMPLERHELGTLDGPSAEYYRICDKAWHAYLIATTPPVIMHGLAIRL